MINSSRKVKEVESLSLSTREKAKRLIRELETEDYDEIDFSSVRDMSRSFTDEFFTRVSDVEVEVRLNEDLEKMRHAVMEA